MTQSDVEFRYAEPHDHAALAKLMLESNRFYWGPLAGADDMTSSAADALVSGRSGCRAILAWGSGEPRGFATISVLHPALNEHGTLFMKDLFVSETARGTGLGRQFMRHIAELAVSLGCRRFDWTAETDNPPAIEFYERLGAQKVEDEVYFRLSEAVLEKFALSDA